MIGLLDNAKHQLTVAGTGMIAEANAGAVDVTGFKLLDAPVVEINADGSLTLRIAVSDAPARKPHKSLKLDDQVIYDNEETPEE